MSYASLYSQFHELKSKIALLNADVDSLKNNSSSVIETSESYVSNVNSNEEILVKIANLEEQIKTFDDKFVSLEEKLTNSLNNEIVKLDDIIKKFNILETKETVDYSDIISKLDTRINNIEIKQKSTEKSTD